MGGFRRPTQRDDSRMRQFLSVERAGVSARDPYYATVVSLLRFGGADASPTFTDDTGKVWTPFGNAQIDTSTGFNTGLFDGVGDYLTTPSSSDFDFGSGDFCVDILIEFITMATGALFGRRDSTGSYFLPYAFTLDSSGKYRVIFTDSNLSYQVNTLGTATASTGVLTHLALTRSGNTLRFFVNGALDYTTTISGATNIAVNTHAMALNAGSADGSGATLNARYRGVRINKGVPRYTAAFVPPTFFPNY